MSDIDAVVVDSLKALGPEWPIREADSITEPDFRPSRMVKGPNKAAPLGAPSRGESLPG